MASLVVLSMFSLPSDAQNHLVKLTNHLEPYGFFRTSAIFDARQSKTDTDDLFYYLPYDKENNLEGKDIWFNPSFKLSAVTTRVGFDLKGFQYGSFNVTGKLEADFYLFNESTASLRLRQAYLDLNWSGLGRVVNSAVLRVGQAWHPMAADMPDVFSLNTGAPFGPFSRTPQVKLDYRLSDALSLTGAAIWQMQYVSAGPNGAKADYIKDACTPELFLGLNYKKDNLLLRAGVNMLSIKPRANNGSVKVDDRITTFTPFLYGQYKSGLFSAKVKTVFAEAGEHVNLNGGYGISGMKSDGASYEYTPTRNSSTWASFMYGKKTQWILFAGYVKNFGTKDDLYGAKDGYAPAANLYFSKNSFSNMNQMWRLTPTVIHNIGKFAIGLEYELTSVQYGDYKTIDGVKYIGANGLAEDNLHWITNNRIQALVKFTF